MQRFAIYANPERDNNYAVSNELIELLQAQGAWTTRNIAEFNTCDALICLGGDGSFLASVRLPETKDLPCIGVNLGSCGFLTEIAPSDLKQAVTALLHDDFSIEERMMLAVEVCSKEGKIIARAEALNDVVLLRGGGQRIITLDLSIAADFVERIPGDGLIVSTPTGSTAYSLAAGGPIIQAGMSLFLITPICPHTLHNRSYIAPDDKFIEVKLDASSPKAALTVDGEDVTMPAGGSVRILKSPRSFKLMRLSANKFYQTITEKIQKRGISK